MDDDEARTLLHEHLRSYRLRSYAELVQMIGEPVLRDVRGASGVAYQLRIEAHWDARQGGAVRVLGTIDDAGWRALLPLCDDFILGADGKLVGE